tara:strand:- start:983 stop:3208 length:2226 start_codon:yes stop_codon:yes gene_type:complete
MANITLAGILKDSIGQIDVGAIVTFTHLTTTGETIKGTSNNLVVAPDGAYSINLQYGQIRVDYTTRFTERFVAIVVVNSDSTATNLPDLLNAAVPPTNAQLLQFQTILADTVTAKNAALVAETGASTAKAGALVAETGAQAAEATLLATQITTAALIASTATFPSSTVINTIGYQNIFDRGHTKWVQNGVTGETASQSPSQLAINLLNDGNGNQWVMVSDGPWNVCKFGAVGDGVVDDVLPIQAAINSVSTSGGAIYNPTGKYKISTSLLIKVNGTVFSGDGYRASEIASSSTTQSAIIIQKDNWDEGANGTSINDVQIKDIKISKSVDSTAGTGIICRLGAELSTSGVKISEFETCMALIGCVNTRHYNLRFFTGSVLTSGTSLLKISPALLASGAYYGGYTHNFSQFLFSGSVTSSAILLQGGEVAWFDNGYLGNIGSQHVLVAPLNDNVNVNNCDFNQVYFDGVAGGSGITAVKMIDNAKTGGSVRNWSFDDCSFGQLDTGFNISHSLVTSLRVDGKFFNIDNQAVVCTSDLEIELNVWATNICTNGGGIGAFEFTDSAIVKVSGVINGTNAQAGVKLRGTLGYVSLPALTIRNSGTRIDDTGATITSYGDYFGSFTPTIAFNGASTGVTYSAQSGKFNKVADSVTFSLNLTMSSKGSDTGNILISGLPVNSEALRSAVALRATSLASTIGDTMLYASVLPSSNDIAIERSSSGSAVLLTNGSVTDTSSFTVSGIYEV